MAEPGAAAPPPHPAPPRVLLDACVLYPAVLRQALLEVARDGALVPLWSPRILAEWAHVAARRGDDAAPAIAALGAAFPQAEVTPDPSTEAGLALPDPADAHVLAAAIAGRADLLVTLNLRDFPQRLLAAHGLRAEAPDTLLMRLWLQDPARLQAAILRVAEESARRSGRRVPLRALLRRARLPRLGKALDAPSG